MEDYPSLTAARGAVRSVDMRWHLRWSWTLRALTVAAAGAVIAAATWAYEPVNSAFSGTSSNPGNTWTGAPAACTPGGQTLLGASDTYVREGFPTLNKATVGTMFVTSSSGQNDRALLKFSLPAVPSGCSLTTATLSLRVTSGVAGRTLEARNISATWTDTVVTWNTQPGTTATAAATAASNTTNGAWVSWNVLTLTQAQYSGNNYGYQIRDQTESSAAGTQSFKSSEDLGGSANYPKLVLAWS
jgi:hypothetical protein